MEIQGKVAVITGAGSGIGLAVAPGIGPPRRRASWGWSTAATR